MKKTNRILSILLAILLTLGIAPMSAQAENTQFELTRDRVRWEKLHFTFDGNGHCPEVTALGIDDVVLTENEDYTLECGRLVDNGGTTEFVPFDQYPSEIGVYICRLHGCGAYCNSDEIATEFQIEENPLGVPVNNGGFLNYVSADGTTSAEVTKKNMDTNGIVWLKEESNGTDAWYGVDNSDGVFEEGSVFWVHWLSEEEGSDLYAEAYQKLDDTDKIHGNKLRMLEIGVMDQKGTKYTSLKKPVNFFVQLDDNWDPDAVEAVYLSEQSDEAVDAKTVPEFYCPVRNDKEVQIVGLSLTHFSLYAVYEKNTQGDGDTCALCGKAHGSSFSGKAIAFLHRVLYKLIAFAQKVFGLTLPMR